MFTRALCRAPGRDLAAGLTTAGLGAPDPDLALAQHSAYVQALRSCGLMVEVLPPLPGYPDACFVEDPAVILPEVVIETLPGAPTRRGEVTPLAANLPDDRPRARITSPGHLEGGDVLVVGRVIWVGRTERTDAEGIRQFTAVVEPLGYRVVVVNLQAGLHLKTEVNHLGGEVLLASPALSDHPAFARMRVLTAAPGEGYPCNTLWVNGTLVTPAGFPGTLIVLEGLGLPILPLEMSEFRKLDGGLTCLSLRF